MNILINAIDAKSFEDLCKRNPGAITSSIMKSKEQLKDNAENSKFIDEDEIMKIVLKNLKNNKYRSEFKNLIGI